MATINKKPTKAHKDKKVVKAHQGMAHIPRQRPIKKEARARRAVNSINERTRGPIAEREINPKSTAYSPKKFNINPSTGQFRGAPRPQAPTIQQPKPVVRPPKIMDGDGGRGGKPIQVQRPKPQSFRVPAVQMPKSIPKPMQPRIMKQGGYVSRAKYGIVDNLKGK